MFIKFFGLDDYADIDFDAELKRVSELKVKVEESNPTKEQTVKLKDSNLEENKYLRIDMNKINNYNHQQDKETDKGSKRKNKSLSFKD